MPRWRLVSTCVVVAVLMALSGQAMAQDAGGGGGGGGGGGRGGRGGGGGGRGNFDPAAMQERMATRMKEQLGVTDEEWTALSPKVEKVTTAQRDSRAGGGGLFGAMGGRGGRGGNGGAAATPQTPVAKAMADLQAALTDKATSAEDIAKKLAALREARAQAEKDLAAARKELKDFVTQRQEATLVMMGILE